MSTPLDYAPRGLKPPRPVELPDRRGRLERTLDRIGLIVVIVILLALLGLGVWMLMVISALSNAF